MNIYLTKMTKDLARQFYNGFENDPAVFLDMSRFTAYVYSDAASDASFERQKQLGRIHLAIMLDETPVGEIILKNINYDKQHCTLSIHMKNDSVKNRGYGTKAEILLLWYAFNELGMETVYADAILKNKRSQHILQKVGFTEIRTDENFRYYRCDKNTWHQPQMQGQKTD